MSSRPERLALDRRHQVGAEREAKILAAWRAGVGRRQLCERFGVPMGTLYTLLRRHGERGDFRDSR